MIILLGPDGSGKSTYARILADATDAPVAHFDQYSTYNAFINVLKANASGTDIICDRFAVCEHPYHQLMNRKFRFTLKAWHNILLFMLAQQPAIILCTHIPGRDEYPDDQYLPHEKLEECLELYRAFFSSHRIPYHAYDYVLGGPEHIEEPDIRWWQHMYADGNYPIGCTDRPELLIVAERMGPNNQNLIPFETGPTGAMMSTMIRELAFPLNTIAITNYVKAERGDPRPPNEQDNDLLEFELTHIRPKRVLLMGKPAQKAYKTVNAHLDADNILMLPHFGAYHHSGRKDMTTWYQALARFMGKEQKPEYQLAESGNL